MNLSEGTWHFGLYRFEQRRGMRIMTRVFQGLAATAGLLFLTAAGTWVPDAGKQTGHVTFRVVSPAFAEDNKVPYRELKSGTYGEKKEVLSTEDAQKALREHFSKKDVKIGGITEKELYFEAEIRDRNNTVIDKVIVDKRTGR